MKGAAAAEPIDMEGASQAAKEAFVVLAEICRLICSVIYMSIDMEKNRNGHGEESLENLMTYSTF